MATGPKNKREDSESSSVSQAGDQSVALDEEEHSGASDLLRSAADSLDGLPTESEAPTEEPKQGSDPANSEVDREVTRRTADADVTVRAHDPEAEPNLDDEVTRQSAVPEFRKREQGEELTRVTPKKRPPLPEAPKPLVKEDDVTRRARPEEIRRRQSGSEVTKRTDPEAEEDEPASISQKIAALSPELALLAEEHPSFSLDNRNDSPEQAPRSPAVSVSTKPEPVPQDTPLDPDKTGKLDGLPPFALLEKIAQLPSEPGEPTDPDKTNKFVRPAASDDEEELEPSSVVELSKPKKNDQTEKISRTTTSSPSPSPTRIDSAHSQPAPEEVGRRLSIGTVVLINIVTLLLGLVVGGIAVLLNLDDLPWLRELVGASTTVTSAVNGQGRPVSDDGTTAGIIATGSDASLPVHDASTDDAVMNFDLPAHSESSEARGADASADANSASEETSENEGSDSGSAALPRVSWVPIYFQPGENRPSKVSRDELRRIANIITSTPGMEVELIGFTAPADGIRPTIAFSLSSARAEAALEQLRAFGPSTRRFSTRSARPDEPPPLPIHTEGVLLAPVLMRLQ